MSVRDLELQEGRTGVKESPPVSWVKSKDINLSGPGTNLSGGLCF